MLKARRGTRGKGSSPLHLQVVTRAPAGCAVQALGGGGQAGVVTPHVLGLFKLPNLLALAVLFYTRVRYLDFQQLFWNCSEGMMENLFYLGIRVELGDWLEMDYSLTTGRRTV